MDILSDKNKQEFGDDYLREIIKALKRAGKDSSGKLIKSLSYKVKDEANGIDIIISSENYLKYVDEGRRRGSYPNITELGKWARINGISKDAVFPIAKSIYKFGIKPTNVLSKSEKSVFNGPAFNNLEDNISENVEDEIINQLKK